MASRREHKEQARAARLAREAELAARAGRVRRLRLLGGVVVAALAVVVVAIVVSTRSGTSAGPGLPPDGARHQIDRAVTAELTGIPQHGTVLGNPKATVTLTYFGDLECPVCRDFTLTVLPRFISQFVRSGEVKIRYRSDCTATCTDHSQSLFDEQQVAAYAAGEQNLFWEYAELFYHEQGYELDDYVNEHYLDALAEQIPALHLTQWRADRSDGGLSAAVSSDAALATRWGVQGTPTLVMEGPHAAAEMVENSDPRLVPTYSDLAAAVAKVA